MSSLENGRLRSLFFGARGPLRQYRVEYELYGFLLGQKRGPFRGLRDACMRVSEGVLPLLSWRRWSWRWRGSGGGAYARRWLACGRLCGLRVSVKWLDAY